MRVPEFRAATESAVGALRAMAERDWTVRAGTLDWDIALTVTHIAAGATKYAVYLAAGATRWSPLVISANPRATNDQLIDAVEISADGLAFVAGRADPTAVGFHAWGMSDASSFLARAANEAVIHAWDAAQGLGITYEPAPHVCIPILRRRYPWLDDVDDPWVTLLTANARMGDEFWIPLEVPLRDWDGMPPRSARPPAIAWERDASARWVAIYP